MPREFICHRCGTANDRGSENCRFCGLQVGWRPTLPYFFRFWRWNLDRMEVIGSMAAPIGATLALSYPGTWLYYLVAFPLIMFSSLSLLWLTISRSPRSEKFK